MNRTYAKALNELLGYFEKTFPEHYEFANRIIIEVEIDKQQDGIADKMREIAKKYNCEKIEVKQMYEVLMNDGYIYTIDKGIVGITLKGRDYLRHGGYVKAEKIKKWRNRANIMTSVFLILGSVATCVIAGEEIYKNHHVSTKVSIPVSPNLLYQQKIHTIQLQVQDTLKQLLHT